MSSSALTGISRTSPTVVAHLPPEIDVRTVSGGAVIRQPGSRAAPRCCPLQRRAKHGQCCEPLAAVRGHHRPRASVQLRPPLHLEVVRQLAEDRAQPQRLLRDVVRTSEHVEALPDLPGFHRGDPLNHYMRVASEPVFCIWSNRYSTLRNEVCTAGQGTDG